MLRRIHSTMVVAGLFLMQSVSAQMNGNYTINKNVSASSTNFQSFTSAVQALQGVSRSDGGPSLGTGVNGAVTITVTAATGPYTEQINIPAITGASATNKITFVGNGEIIQHNSGSTEPAVIKINGADYLTFDNLLVRTQNTTYATGFWLLNTADYNTIKNCKIDISSSTYTGTAYSTGIAITGVLTSFTSYTSGGIKARWTTIENNEIYGSSTNNGMYAGIVMNGTSSNTNHGTIVRNNYIRNFYVYGIYSYYYHDGTTFEGNTIVRGTKTSITTFYGIYNYMCTNTMFKGNYIHDGAPTNATYTFSGFGIYDYYGTTSNMGPKHFHNNIIRFTNGYYLYGIYTMYYASSKEILHNTIYIRPWSGNMGSAYGIQVYDYNYNDVPIKNNVVDIDFNSGTGYTFFYYFPYGLYGKFDNNVIPRRSNLSSHYTGYDAGTGQNWQTIQNWRASPMSPDANSIDIRPSYVNASTGNFQPTLIDMDGLGTGLGVTTDFNGNSRSATNPDPGAIEFNIPINVTGITFPTAICQGATTNVEVTITNSSSLNLSNFYVNYKVNGTVVSSEQHTGTINAGASGNFTFSVPVVSTNTGNFVLEAYVRGKTPVTQVNYSVNPSPVGSYVSKGSVFQGTFNSGDVLDPDIVAYGDNIRYSIEPPAGFSSSQYGTQWDFSSWELITPNGTLAGSQHTKTNPTGGANAVSSFTPVIGQSDSTYLLRYAIRSVTNGCIAPVVERRLFVAPRPVASFTANAVCDGVAMPFDNNTTLSSGSLSYVWRFGDGDSTALINPDHVYPAPGTYNVELVSISNYGYTNMANLTVTVYENPTAEFAYTNVCEGSAMNFVDGSLIPTGTPSYSWDFGDGSALGSGSTPSHQYATPGVYTVGMTVTSNGCSDQTTHYVTYAPRAVVDFTPGVVACNNDPVLFTNNTTLSSGQVGYLWEFGENNALSTQKHSSYDYSGYGTFNITLTATTTFGCADTKTRSINLTEAPVAAFTNTSLCDVDQVDFTNTSQEPAGITTYEWVFSDGSSYMTKDVSKIFPGVGEHSVTLKVSSNNGCSDEVTSSVSIDESPKAEFYADDVCEGTDVKLMNATVGNNGNLTYSWDFGAAGTSNAMNPVISLGAGSHDIELTVTTPGGCMDVVTNTVNVNAIPQFTALDVESAQNGNGRMILTGTVTSGADYVVFWGDGGRTPGIATGGVITETYDYLADGVFTVSVRLENAGCENTQTDKANVLRLSLAALRNGELNVYPNPGSGVFHLDMSGIEAVNMVNVYSSNGQLIQSIPATALSNQAIIDLSLAPAGVYLVSVQTAEGMYNARITLNK